MFPLEVFLVILDYDNISDEFVVALLYVIQVVRLYEECVFILDVDDRFVFLPQHDQTLLVVHAFTLLLHLFPQVI